MSGFSVNTNNNAMAALRTLSQTNKSMSQVQSHINTGQLVSSASDNASTFAIAQGMRGDIAGLKAVKSTLQLGETTVNVAKTAAEQIFNKLNEMKTKVTEGQASNRDSAAIQRDVKSISDQINSIADAAQFNGVNLLKSDTAKFNVVSSLNRTDAKTVGVASIDVDHQDLTANGLGVAGINVQPGSATVKFDSTLDPAAGDTMTLNVFGLAKDGTNTTVQHVFEFTDGVAAPTTVPVDDGTGVGVVQVHAVQIDPTTSQSERLGKLVSAMKDAGFSVAQQDDGSLSISSSSAATNSTSPAQVALMGTGLSADITSTITGFSSGTRDAGTGNPAAAMKQIEDAINEAKVAVAKFGTASNQLSSQKDFVSSLSDMLEEGVGSLVDADLAEESAKLQALQTKQQLGMQALSIANQGPSAVMSLFR